jgi:hypothetical protein
MYRNTSVRFLLVKAGFIAAEPLIENSADMSQINNSILKTNYIVYNKDTSVH